MAQYIEKSVLVAELERRKDAALMRQQNLEAIGQETALNEMIAFELNRIISLIDTFEVKDVDLEKEYKDFVEEDPVYNKLVNSIVGKAVAKHFFELGLAASNPLTVKDIKKIYHLVNDVSDDLGVRAMYVNIYQEALKRFKAQKGE